MFWFTIAIVAGITGLMVKLYFPILLMIGLMVMTQIRKEPTIGSWFLKKILVLSIVISMIVVFFDLPALIDNVIGLRLAAVKTYNFSLTELINNFKQEGLLLKLILVLIVETILITVFKKLNRMVVWLLLWLFCHFLYVLSFRPVFLHHLSLIYPPLVITIIYLYRLLLPDRYSYTGQLILLSYLVTLTILSIKLPSQSLSIKEKKLIELIKKQTVKNDKIVTDESKFYYLSGRLPAPALVDLSIVRIETGKITTDQFEAIIERERPKLIILWNGRLLRLIKDQQWLEKLGYSLVVSYQKDKLIYGKSF